jgi:hypothetical protein
MLSFDIATIVLFNFYCVTDFKVQSGYLLCDAICKQPARGAIVV